MNHISPSSSKSSFVISNPDLDLSNSTVLYYLVVLNCPLSRSLILHLLKLSPFIVCGDGGANRYFTALGTDLNQEKYLPNVITGDFDSLEPFTKNYYEKLGVPFIHDPDQDSTDLDKSMSQILKKVAENAKTAKKTHKIVLTGCLGDRFDHNLSSLSNLAKYTKILASMDSVKDFTIQVIHQLTIATCLLEGSYVYDRSQVLEKKEDMGIFPLNGPVKKIETQGLKWNLGGEYGYLKFGEFISSSNQFVSDSLEIETSDAVFLITSLNENFRI